MTNADASTPEPGPQALWRERAVARSLDSARSRAEERVQRFLDATVELIRENGGLDFTVQDVVGRSNQSLRSFYQFFDGKQHLLLAVYEASMQAASNTLAGDSRFGRGPTGKTPPLCHHPLQVECGRSHRGATSTTPRGAVHG